MKYEIRQMLKTGGGAIVNNASIAGMIADPGISAYVAAKHGVIGLSKAAAIEYAAGNPDQCAGSRFGGNAMTGLGSRFQHRAHFLANTPIGRVAKPEEIADMVLFLCSDLASFAAGQAFAVDGGYTAH